MRFSGGRRRKRRNIAPRSRNRRRKFSTHKRRRMPPLRTKHRSPDMEIYLPTLEGKVTALVVAFRFVVFAMMVAGFVFAMSSGRASGASLFKPLLKAVVIVAAIAY